MTGVTRSAAPRATASGAADLAAQWLEAVERDYSRPSLVGWCPLNETYQKLHDRMTRLDDVIRAVFLATKAMDTSRPVIDASGCSHRVLETGVYDSSGSQPVSRHNSRAQSAATRDAMEPSTFMKLWRGKRDTKGAPSMSPLSDDTGPRHPTCFAPPLPDVHQAPSCP